ncbi:unnamed protein product [Cercospora beticola]|nr:unnamed protein product [Cercospora beticola]
MKFGLSVAAAYLLIASVACQEGQVETYNQCTTNANAENKALWPRGFCARKRSDDHTMIAGASCNPGHECVDQDNGCIFTSATEANCSN